MTLFCNALTLFCNIARDQSCIKKQIATRQLAVRNITDIPWFSINRKTLNMYDLPSAYDLLENPSSKEKWKCLLNEQIHGRFEESWRDEIASKSSLKYLSPESVKVGKVHQIYSSVRSNTLDRNGLWGLEETATICFRNDLFYRFRYPLDVWNNN